MSSGVRFFFGVPSLPVATDGTHPSRSAMRCTCTSTQMPDATSHPEAGAGANGLPQHLLQALTGLEQAFAAALEKWTTTVTDPTAVEAHLELLLGAGMFEME